MANVGVEKNTDMIGKVKQMENRTPDDTSIKFLLMLGGGLFARAAIDVQNGWWFLAVCDLILILGVLKMVKEEEHGTEDYPAHGGS